MNIQYVKTEYDKLVHAVPKKRTVPTVSCSKHLQHSTFSTAHHLKYIVHYLQTM